MTAEVERRYAMIRIQAGDYLLPSNDGRTLWRLTSYVEDGSAMWVAPGGDLADGIQIKGTFWQVAKYDRPFNNQGEWQDDDFLEWGHWLTWVTTLSTRREAIKEALTANP